MPATPSNLDEDTAVAPASDAASSTEHLYSLPRMSPTAGVGNEEYVAINVCAVLSLILGFSGILAIMNDLLVVIPLAALLTAVLALVQINRSNGTQGGRGIAMAGLFLAVSISSFTVASDVMDRISRVADDRAIDQVCRLFGQDLRDRRYDAAYDLFSQRFKSIESRQDFVNRLKTMQDSLDRDAAAGGIGPINAARFSGVANYYTDADTGAMTAQGEIDFNYDKTDGVNPLAAGFRKSGEGWTISSIPDFFPKK